jgi:Uncharacterised nucleotidyltransferase
MPSMLMPDLLDAVKRAAEVLRGADIPFALCGGLAVFARGGTDSEHDVDLLIQPEDVDRTLAAFDEAGFRTVRPPEDWLVKAYHGDILIDLIFRPVNRPVSHQVLADTDPLPIGAVVVPVISGAELMIHALLRLSVQECDFSGPLLLARTIREQVDFALVRDQTKESPYARAFLFLAGELDLIGTPS